METKVKDIVSNDYEGCSNPHTTANALNGLWNKLNLFRDDEYSNPHTHRNMQKYKYAKQVLLDYIKDNVDTILELRLDEKDKLYCEILDKAVEEYK